MVHILFNASTDLEVDPTLLNQLIVFTQNVKKFKRIRWNIACIKTHCIQGAILFQISIGFRMERYSHILEWCGRIFIKGHMRNHKCRKECSFIKLVLSLVYPFNNEMTWFVILMHQNPFLSLFQVCGNIEIAEGYSSQTYSCHETYNIKKSKFSKKNLYCVGAGTPRSLATQPTMGGGSCCELEIGQNLILDHDVY